jgi:hypothetical protein
MPLVIRKKRNEDCYVVKNKETGKVHAKCTTRAKAEAQVRLLMAIDRKKYPYKGSNSSFISYETL